MSEHTGAPAAAAAARYDAGRSFFDSDPQDLQAAKVEFAAAYEAAYALVYDAHAAAPTTVTVPTVDSPEAAAATRQLVDVAWYLAQTYVLMKDVLRICERVREKWLQGGVVLSCLAF